MKHTEKIASRHYSRFIEPITSFRVVNTHAYPINISLFAPARNGVENLYIIPNDYRVTYRQVQSDLLSNSWLVSRVRISVCDYPAPVVGLNQHKMKSRANDEITLSNKYGKALSVVHYDFESIHGSKSYNPLDTKRFFARRVDKKILDINYVSRVGKEASLTLTIPPLTAFDVSLFCNLIDYLTVRTVDRRTVSFITKDTVSYIRKGELELSKIMSYFTFDKLQMKHLNIQKILHRDKERSDILNIYNLAKEVIEGCPSILKDFRSKEYKREVQMWETHQNNLKKVAKAFDSTDTKKNLDEARTKARADRKEKRLANLPTNAQIRAEAIANSTRNERFKAREKYYRKKK